MCKTASICLTCILDRSRRLNFGTLSTMPYVKVYLWIAFQGDRLLFCLSVIASYIFQLCNISSLYLSRRSFDIDYCLKIDFLLYNVVDFASFRDVHYPPANATVRESITP